MDVRSETTPQPIVGAASEPLVREVWKLAEPLCLSKGLELLFVEFHREQSGRILRLYLDRPGGVTLDDCSAVSRQLSDILDATLDTDAAYRLEVSSPGPHRPLAKLSDFQRFVGRRVKVRTIRAVDGQKNFTGTLDSVTPETVRITTRDKNVEISFGGITKAQLVEEEQTIHR
jgi:ribosome maturation factor RimP